MDKFVAIVCDDEQSAYRAADALMTLQGKGDLAVFAYGIISKTAAGEINTLKSENEGPFGLLFGALYGALIGALSGPIGMAFGTVAGGMLGSYRDLFLFGIDQVMIDRVSEELTAGKTCVVASVEEAWTTPLDPEMEALGATVHRKRRIDLVDDRMAAEMAELNAELAELDAERETAAEKRRAALDAHMSALRERAADLRGKIDDRITALDDEVTSRLDTLDAQIEKASGDARAKFQKRREQLEREFRDRREKLQATVKDILD